MNLRHKKKLKKKKSSQVPCLSSEEEKTLSSLLQDFQNTGPAEIVNRITGPLLAGVFVESLPLEDKATIPLLTAVMENFEDKKVHKSVKKVLFKLKKAGITVEGFPREANHLRPGFEPVQREEPVAYIGPMDMLGARPVLISFHRTLKGMDTGIGIVSDELGIQHFIYNNFSKKVLKELRDTLSQKAGALVKTSLSHAATMLENAYLRHLEIHSDKPDDYLEFRPWLLENVSLLDRPVIFDFIPQASLSDEMPTGSQLEELFEHNLMQYWQIEYGHLSKFLDKMHEVDDSPIVLTKAQKSDRLREIKLNCIEELFPSSKRATLKRRFEEMAFIFFKIGEEDTSILSLTAARSLEGKENVFKINPTIEFLLDRSIVYYSKTVEDNDDKKDSPSESLSNLILS